MQKDWSGRVGYGFIFLFVGAVLFFAYDILFSTPDHQQGTVIEKIHVPARTSSAATPYAGTRRGKYFITVQREDQWLAVVKMDNGEILTVHCHPDHYSTKNVGDVIHFKKFEGNPVHIEYFAHNEEED